MRRVALIAVLGALLAGCGGEETVSPSAETVIGEQPQAQPQPQGDPMAGAWCSRPKAAAAVTPSSLPNSTGQTGPHLNDLAALAEKAGQPVEEFTRQSITQPGAYVEPGFPDGVMPTWSGTEQELSDLVAFLTQS